MEAIGDLTETRFFLVLERKQGVWRGVNGICELCASRRGFEGKSRKEMEMFPSFPPLPSRPSPSNVNLSQTRIGSFA